MEIKFRMNEWIINIKGAKVDQQGETSKSLPDFFGSARQSAGGGRGGSNARGSLNEHTLNVPATHPAAQGTKLTV